MAGSVPADRAPGERAPGERAPGERAPGSRASGGARPAGEEPPRIVVGVDGSARSLEALRWAADEAHRRGAVLEVLHARFARKELLELADAEGYEARTVEDAVVVARELAPDVEVVGRLTDPPADQALVDASRGADLLVVGARGLSGLQELALGSVSLQCVHHAHCPVVVVRPFGPVR